MVVRGGALWVVRGWRCGCVGVCAGPVGRRERVFEAGGGARLGRVPAEIQAEVGILQLANCYRMLYACCMPHLMVLLIAAVIVP